MTYTIFDDDGELGLIGIAPGRGQSPEVQLKMYSKAANLSSGSPWYWFGSLTDPEYAFNERDRKFRTLCSSIFTYFLMIHNLDKAGRPKKVQEYSEQGKATSGDGPGRRPGRPPHTDQQWQERYEQAGKVIQKAEAAGISEKTASRLMGTPYNTFRDWKRRMSKK